jgi:hypothetical protein
LRNLVSQLADLKLRVTAEPFRGSRTVRFWIDAGDDSTGLAIDLTAEQVFQWGPDWAIPAARWCETKAAEIRHAFTGSVHRGQ